MKKLFLWILLFSGSSVSAETTYLECILSGKETSATNGKIQASVLSPKTVPIEILQTDHVQSIEIKGPDPYNIHASPTADNKSDINHTDNNKFHMKSTSHLTYQGTNVLVTNEIEINRITGYLLANRVFTLRDNSTNSNIFTSLTGSCRKFENTRKF